MLSHKELEQPHLLCGSAVVLSAIATFMCERAVLIGVIASFTEGDDMVYRGILALHFFMTERANALITFEDYLQRNTLDTFSKALSGFIFSNLNTVPFFHFFRMSFLPIFCTCKMSLFIIFVVRFASFQDNLCIIYIILSTYFRLTWLTRMLSFMKGIQWFDNLAMRTSFVSSWYISCARIWLFTLAKTIRYSSFITTGMTLLINADVIAVPDDKINIRIFLFARDTQRHSRPSRWWLMGGALGLPYWSRQLTRLARPYLEQMNYTS